MRTIEVLSAVIAEELMARNTLIHLDPEEICWPDGNVTKPPSNETKKGRGKAKKKNLNSKHGVYGKIVHEYGVKSTVSREQLTSNIVLVTAQEQQEKEKEASEKENGQGRRNGNFRKYLFLICLEFNNFLASEIGHIIFFCSGKWDYPEQGDLLSIFKFMVLGGIKKDNYKEMSKRMTDSGWNRTNDQCRHEVI